MKKIRPLQFIAIAIIACGCALVPASLLSNTSSPTSDSSISVEAIYTVRPDVLAVELNVGNVEHGTYEPYEAQASDKVVEANNATWLIRDRQTIGALIGRDRDTLYTLDTYSGSANPLSNIDKASAYQIMSQDDANFERETSPELVFLKSKPTDMVQIDRGDFAFPMRHTIYLKLGQPLTDGNTYQLSLPSGLSDNLEFRYEPQFLHSEAVHVSHIGFRPDDPSKVGFLSTWMGTGGSLGYRDGLEFWLQDTETLSEAYRGTTQLSKSNTEPEDPFRNYSGTDVYLMDFSEFNQPGNYQLCVEGIGCSFSFAISETVWKDPFYISARGFYHQRSGIELSEPHTRYSRPRSFHPEEGLTVYESDVSLMNTNMGLNLERLNVFDALKENSTDKPVPNAWGGYMDAGDWDRRIQHLNVARRMLELVQLFPEYTESLSLNIPESNNNLPDIVDEALWGIDFFKRTQTAEGGIRGGIESEDHPRFGETSWKESQNVYAFAPDMWSSYIYAGVTARAAYILNRFDPTLSTEYEASALKAMAYAEGEYAQWQGSEPDITDQRNLAAVELWRLTNDEQWHDLFLQTTAFISPQDDVFKHRRFSQRDAAFVYATMPSSQTDRNVHGNAKFSLLSSANQLIEWQEKTAFKWSKLNSHTPVAWGGSLGAPKAIAFLHAHALSNEEKYLKAAVLSTQFAAGANPDNMVYTTGIGHRSPQNPLIVDQRITGQPAPPGITVYGPSDFERLANDRFLQTYSDKAEPPMVEWPPVEGYFDVYRFVPINEFTIHQTMVPTMYTWGYLAARQHLN